MKLLRCPWKNFLAGHILSFFLLHVSVGKCFKGFNDFKIQLAIELNTYLSDLDNNDSAPTRLAKTMKMRRLSKSYYCKYLFHAGNHES